MKIEIEWTCSYEAKLRIAGKEMTVRMRPGITQLEGIKGDTLSNTFGGIVASQLYGKVADIMQAQCIADEFVNPDGARETAWLRLTDKQADTVEKRIW